MGVNPQGEHHRLLPRVRGGAPQRREAHRVPDQQPRHRLLSPRPDHRSPRLPEADSRYGVSKVFGEALGSLYADKYGMQFLMVRIGNVNPGAA